MGVRERVGDLGEDPDPLDQGEGARVGEALMGLAVAGLAFKAATDDLRESPNVDLARKLLAAGFARGSPGSLAIPYARLEA